VCNFLRIKDEPILKYLDFSSASSFGTFFYGCLVLPLDDTLFSYIMDFVSATRIRPLRVKKTDTHHKVMNDYLYTR